MFNWCENWSGWMWIFPFVGLIIMTVFLILIFQWFRHDSKTENICPSCSHNDNQGKHPSNQE